MLYDLAIVIYDFIVHLAAPFSRKPRKMMKGHWVVYELLRQQVEKGEQYIWFHAASLGEFEQGRPLIEMIREKYPNYKILLTFFSPSGYEVRKHYRGADIVCYLPFDKPRNVKKFLDIANPCMAFFIKYEFWKNYLDELHKRRIPVYSVSSIFRREQIFFKWYGGTYRNVLKDFDHLFVQNEASKRYLSKIGISRVTVVGDTRFDRVLQIREEAKELPLVEKFKGNNSFTFVAGSSWGPDEDLFLEYFNNHPEMKLIIAPHVIDENYVMVDMHEEGSLGGYSWYTLPETLRSMGLPKDLRMLQVSGDDMAPYVNCGDAVMYDPRVRRIQANGVFVFQIGDRFVVRRVQRGIKGDIRLKCDNPLFEDEVLDESELDESALAGGRISVAGQVVGRLSVGG